MRLSNAKPMNRLHGGDGVKRKLRAKRAARSLGEREGETTDSPMLHVARFARSFFFYPIPPAEPIHRLSNAPE